MVKTAQPLEPKDQLRNTLEEARMVLPGIQALFGFQLIAVFQPTFAKTLNRIEQELHLLAVGLAALAAALVIAPAALHRRSAPDCVTDRLLHAATRLLTLGMWPLTFAVFLDFGILARIVLKDAATAWTLASALLAVYVWLWVVLPRTFKAHGEAASLDKKAASA